MSESSRPAKLMKDGLNKAAIRRISRAFSSVLPRFDQKAFERRAQRGLDQLELKERVGHVIQALDNTIDMPFSDLVTPMCEIPNHWDYGDPDDNTRKFAAWPVIDFVAHKGLSQPKKAMRIFESITSLYSAEFAIRHFLIHHYQITFEQMLKWCQHKDKHVRRLASEGCRPRLPWGIQLKQFMQDPRPIFEILEQLKYDESQYVVRSVANNLNDISKDNPDFLLDRLLQWKQLDQNKTEWIIKHGCRSLIKAGHPRSFELLGYTAKPKITVERFVCDKTVCLGEALSFSFRIAAKKSAQKLVVDYAIDFVKANGTLSRKVFKLKNCQLQKGEQLEIDKQHSFKIINTRTYHMGVHAIAVLVNGAEYGKKEFELVFAKAELKVLLGES